MPFKDKTKAKEWFAEDNILKLEAAVKYLQLFIQPEKRF